MLRMILAAYLLMCVCSSVFNLSFCICERPAPNRLNHIYLNYVMRIIIIEVINLHFLTKPL